MINFTLCCIPRIELIVEPNISSEDLWKILIKNMLSLKSHNIELIQPNIFYFSIVDNSITKNVIILLSNFTRVGFRVEWFPFLTKNVY